MTLFLVLIKMSTDHLGIDLKPNSSFSIRRWSLKENRQTERGSTWDGCSGISQLYQLSHSAILIMVRTCEVLRLVVL